MRLKSGEKKIMAGAATFFFFCLVPSFGLVAKEGALSTQRILMYEQHYEQSAHASNKLANEINEGAVKNSDDAKCLICHTAQGAMEWADKGFDPGFETPSIPEPGAASGPTCLTCHDPGKNPSDPMDPMLRLEGKTPKLLSGFVVEAAGKGALCMVCHNSRRGLYNDETKPRMNHRAPHETSSTDVLMGQNFFFIQVGEPGIHAYLDHTCVECHMTPVVGKNGDMSQHTFKAGWTNCKACHDDYSDDDLEAMRQSFIDGRDRLKGAIDESVTRVAEAGIKAGDFRILVTNEDESEDKDYTTFTSGKVSGVNSRYFHGGQAYDIKIDGKPYLALIKLIQSQGHKLLDTVQGQVIAKAGWNLYMFDHDRSEGAHSPALIRKVFDASLKKLAETDFSTITPLK